MIASAPFDNWWHNAYGLDLQFITPPHALLSLGYFATKIGTMAWLASIINRSQRVLQERLSSMLLVTGAFCVTLLAASTMPSTLRVNMHTAACYLAVAMLVPCMMIAAGWGSARKWGCTIVAAVYMSVGMIMEWLLPFFSAEPKVGPVYHNVTHLIPLPFPLLLIVPAFVADLLLQKLKQRSSWTKAICVGPAFVLSFFAVQWPFANFLMSPASRNWFFGTGYFAYADPAGILYDAYKFKIAEKSLEAFMLTMLAALVVSIVTTRLGLGWGNWMRRVRR
jgi:hypothetical protein